MYSIIKIFRQDLQQDQHESFSFNSVDYKTIRGIYLIGQAEVSLCLKNGKQVQFESDDITTLVGVEPNKRAMILDKPLDSELILGTIKKTRIKGKASIYLLLK